MSAHSGVKGHRLWRLLGGVLLLVAGWVHANTVHYYYTDPQGTVLAKADAQGNIIASYDYTPYGSIALGAAPDGPGYTGHVNDPESGLVYMQARYYDPATGRFLSVDPIGPSPGNLFNFNRYDYANNNSINNIDLDGKFPFFTHMILTFGAARGAGIGFAASLHYAIQAGWADLRPHAQDTTVAAVAQHAMSIKGEPISEAQGQYRALVSRDITQGLLGYAAHAIQDSFARAHRGFQIWDGKFFSKLGLAHIWADITASHSELHDAYDATLDMFRSVKSQADRDEGGSDDDGGSGIGDAEGSTSRGLCGSALVVGCNGPNDPLPGSAGDLSGHPSVLRSGMP